jgi:hypothetical protein
MKRVLLSSDFSANDESVEPLDDLTLPDIFDREDRG